MRQDAKRAVSNASGRWLARPEALDAALSLPDGMSPGGRTQNRSLRYKRLERSAHRETERMVLFFADAPHLFGPLRPALVPDGQHLLRREKEGQGGPPCRVAWPPPDTRILPRPPRPEPAALYGLRPVHSRKNPRAEGRKRLPGRPPNMEVPPCRHLLPPLWS